MDAARRAEQVERGLESHEDICGKRWAEARDQMKAFGAELAQKHQENRDAMDLMQKRMLLAVIFILGTVLLKGPGFEKLLAFILAGG